MQYIAKPVLEDKFWIIEDNGQKVGTIRSNEHGVTLQVGKENRTFKELDELKSKMKVSFTGKDLLETQKHDYDVHGFPCKTKPYNPIYDLKRKLPLYTKTEGSQSFFCAGYFCIKFDNGWVPAYCPKLITLGRNEFLGPFKTKLEANEALRLQNG